jgi:hypothetical protein
MGSSLTIDVLMGNSAVMVDSPPPTKQQLSDQQAAAQRLNERKAKAKKKEEAKKKAEQDRLEKENREMEAEMQLVPPSPSSALSPLMSPCLSSISLSLLLACVWKL